MNTWIGFSALLACGALLGTTGLLSRNLARELSSFQIVLLRDAIVLIPMLCLMIFVSDRPSNWQQLKRYFFPLLGLGLTHGLTTALFITAMIISPLNSAAFALYFSSILLSMLISFLAFKEPLSPLHIFSLLLVFAGLFIFAYPFEAGLGLGFYLGVVAGISLAISNVLRRGLTTPSKELMVMSQACGDILVSFAFIVALNAWPSLHLTAFSYINLIIYAAIILASIYLLVIGFQNFSLDLGNVLLSTELLFATLIGYLVYQEQPSNFQLLGSACLFIAIILINMHRQRA